MTTKRALEELLHGHRDYFDNEPIFSPSKKVLPFSLSLAPQLSLTKEKPCEPHEESSLSFVSSKAKKRSRYRSCRKLELRQRCGAAIENGMIRTFDVLSFKRKPASLRLSQNRSSGRSLSFFLSFGC